MSCLDEKKPRRRSCSSGKTKKTLHSSQSPEETWDKDKRVATATDVSDEGIPDEKRRRSRRRSHRLKQSEPRRRNSRKSILDDANDNSMELSATTAEVKTNKAKTRRRSSAKSRTSAKLQDKAERIAKSHTDRTTGSRRRSSASDVTAGIGSSVLRRPSLFGRSPSSPHDCSVSSRDSNSSRCSTGVLQFDPTKSDYVVKRRKDTKLPYSIAANDGKKFEGSIANLVHSPEKAKTLSKPSPKEVDQTNEDDPFALLDSESKMDDTSTMHQSILSIAVSAGSSLTGFSDGEDAFSDFDPMDFPDHRLDDESEGSSNKREHIMPDYLVAENLRDPAHQQHHSSGGRPCGRNYQQAPPCYTGADSENHKDYAATNREACRRPSGSAFQRRRESWSIKHQAFAISLEREACQDELPYNNAFHPNASMKLADSSASFIALMQNDEDSDSEGKENETSRLGKSLMSLNLEQQTKPRTLNDTSRGFGRSFSLRGILQNRRKRGGPDASDDGSVGSHGGSIRNLFQSEQQRHSLLEE